MPGVYSSPLLIVCGVWLFSNAHLWEEHLLPDWYEKAV